MLERRPAAAPFSLRVDQFGILACQFQYRIVAFIDVQFQPIAVDIFLCYAASAGSAASLPQSSPEFAQHQLTPSLGRADEKPVANTRITARCDLCKKFSSVSLSRYTDIAYYGESVARIVCLGTELRDQSGIDGLAVEHVVGVSIRTSAGAHRNLRWRESLLRAVISESDREQVSWARHHSSSL